MNRKKVTDIFQRLKEQNPAPETELKHHSVFELLVAVTLSAQSTDRSVNRATGPLFQVANTPEKILNLGEAGLKDYIKTIGLFNTKTKNILLMCEQLIKKHNSQVPNDRTALEALPGVGRKTANVILNTAFGQPTMAVDTHIFRVSNRMKIAPGKTVRMVEDQLLEIIPKAYHLNAHHWLILHGRYTCTAKNPKCHRCVLYDLCEAEERQSI